jgi:DinB family protein
MNTEAVLRALSTVLVELVDGATADAGWVLNRKDPGLLKSLDKLPAAAASAVPLGGRSSIAAQVDHLRYGLQLLNRWGQGEEDPFSDADYSASWRRVTVSDPEWKTLRDQLRAEAQRWRDVLRQTRDLSGMELTGAIASVAHLAYHLGAIRQIDGSIRGPTARD